MPDKLSQRIRERSSESQRPPIGGVKDTRKHRRPGPEPESGTIWSNCPEFFDNDVQMVLEEVRASLRHETSDATFALFCVVNRVAKQNHWTDPLLRGLAFGPFVTFNESGRRNVTRAWNELGTFYSVAPEQVAKIMLVLSKFHSQHPRNWSTRTKVMFLTPLSAEKHGGRLRSSELVKWVKKAFGTDVTENNCKKAISAERQSRAKILFRWKGQIGSLSPLASCLLLDDIELNISRGI